MLLFDMSSAESHIVRVWGEYQRQCTGGILLSLKVATFSSDIITLRNLLTILALWKVYTYDDEKYLGVSKTDEIEEFPSSIHNNTTTCPCGQVMHSQ